jgi:hypothetical protein
VAIRRASRLTGYPASQALVAHDRQGVYARAPDSQVESTGIPLALGL